MQTDIVCTTITGTVHADRYMYIYGNVSLNSSENEKMFQTNF